MRYNRQKGIILQSSSSFNHIYPLIWSQVQILGWCTEIICEQGKPASLKKTFAAMLVLVGAFGIAIPQALSAPTGGVVTGGNGAIAQSGTVTTITQNGNKLAIDWNTFSTAANESIIFLQPSATAIALNRILGSDPSTLLGSLTANGQVFILNPNGILFGSGAQVNVGGLVASTLNLSNEDFLAGKYRLSGDGTGSVVNQGSIAVTSGGYVALLAPEVRNEGIITATMGTALLGAGDNITLNLDNGSLLGYSIDQGSLHSLVENKQLIQADGGQVYLTAKAANTLSIAVVNNTGIIEARTLQNRNGVIKLIGDMKIGQVNVGGILDASAPVAGNGGFIETSAAHVKVADDVMITTKAANGTNGTWLIDPTDFTIAASGGDMTGVALSGSLASSDVVIQSNGGDINVNTIVSWGANSLTLRADNDINVNATLNGSGTAGLALEYAQTNSNGTYNINAPVNLAATGSFSTKHGSDAAIVYTIITDLGMEGSTTGTDLQGMGSNLSGNYVLGANIDASATSGWNNGEGFDPVAGYIGNNTFSFFTGNFDGLGHTITGLVINRPRMDSVGLFGLTKNSTIQNVGLVGGNTVGEGAVGALVGQSYSSTFSNVYNTGNVSGAPEFEAIGGLVGFFVDGTLTNSHNTGSVSGSNMVGGLVGYNVGGTISNSYNTGSVTGDTSGTSCLCRVGGLVGLNVGGTISNSYNTGEVSGFELVGGLVGNGGNISDSYNTGLVSGIYYVGSLTGMGENINNSYSTGNVSNIANVDGLIAYSDVETSDENAGLNVTEPTTD